MKVDSDRERSSWLLDDAMSAQLLPFELFWRDVQPFLASRGYALRPRYHPDWIPSWRLTGEYPHACEDSQTTPAVCTVMDAFRITDGRRVALKRVKKDRYGRNEVAILQYFSTEPRRSDPRNRCVPLLDVLDPDPDKGDLLLVTPHLFPNDRPGFVSVADCLEFCKQIVEGLAFIHEHNVEHRDCCTTNIMMEAEALYPAGRHPQFASFTADFRQIAKPLRRTDIPIKYYFIDFGHSAWFPSAKARKPLFLRQGQDRTAPELRYAMPIDGFKLDIYCVGNLIRLQFLRRFPELRPILDDLVTAMTCANPAQRITSAEADSQLRTVIHAVTPRLLSARLRRRNERPGDRFRADLEYHVGTLKRRLCGWNRRQSIGPSKLAHIPYRLDCVEAAEYVHLRSCVTDDTFDAAVQDNDNQSIETYFGEEERLPVLEDFSYGPCHSGADHSSELGVQSAGSVSTGLITPIEESSTTYTDLCRKE